jgi:hypothetical protein
MGVLGGEGVFPSDRESGVFTFWPKSRMTPAALCKVTPLPASRICSCRERDSIGLSKYLKGYAVFLAAVFLY